MAGPLRFYPPYTNGLEEKNIVLIVTVFLLREDTHKKVVFCLVARGVYPSYTLSGPTTIKTTFLCVSSLTDYHIFVILNRILMAYTPCLHPTKLCIEEFELNIKKASRKEKLCF